jgi:hypothetical protein
MPNRFIRKIKSGEIDTIEELKSEFKELAKRTHPDLRGPGARIGAEAEFVAVKDEYEAALRNFERHRFGARRARSGGAPETYYESHNAPGAMSDASWACLALLLKRGFPKAPRHEKEKLRYEYAVWRLAEELDPESRSRFASCEGELLLAKASGDPALEAELDLLRLLLDFRALGLAPMRTEIVMAMGRLAANPSVGPGFRSFARALGSALGIGPEIA